MAFQDLRDFIALLERKGQLKHIKAPVNCELEITEITDRVSKAGGPALLFENVVGYDMPVLINIFGSEERMSWALGVNNLNELGESLKKWIDMVQNRPPEGLMEKIKLVPELAELARIGPKTVSHAPCHSQMLARRRWALPNADDVP
jgi:4-hydroxy-3-polyprenylbenzoate decarboxylase